jgi:hypothetical protein
MFTLLAENDSLARAALLFPSLPLRQLLKLRKEGGLLYVIEEWPNINGVFAVKKLPPGKGFRVVFACWQSGESFQHILRELNDMACPRILWDVPEDNLDLQLALKNAGFWCEKIVGKDRNKYRFICAPKPPF